MTEDDVERVRDLLAGVPSGRVVTYGDLATAAGLRSPRMVGTILAQDSADLPWHRVVRADGTCAPVVATEQHARLSSEGVPAVDGRVDLASLRHPLG